MIDLEATTSDKVMAHRLLGTLAERYRYVVVRRLQGDLLREIAADMRLSVDRVRQIEQKSYRTMRHCAYRWYPGLREPPCGARALRPAPTGIASHPDVLARAAAYEARQHQPTFTPSQNSTWAATEMMRFASPLWNAQKNGKEIRL